VSCQGAQLASFTTRDQDSLWITFFGRWCAVWCAHHFCRIGTYRAVGTDACFASKWYSASVPSLFICSYVDLYLLILAKAALRDDLHTIWYHYVGWFRVSHVRSLLQQDGSAARLGEACSAIGHVRVAVLLCQQEHTSCHAAGWLLQQAEGHDNVWSVLATFLRKTVC
jgi:hypothetical protein